MMLMVHMWSGVVMMYVLVVSIRNTTNTTNTTNQRNLAESLVFCSGVSFRDTPLSGVTSCFGPISGPFQPDI